MIMKRDFLLLALLCLATMINAQQPYSGCYHPEDVKNWTPGADPNNVFNRSTVALQSRFVDNSIKANPNSTFSETMVSPCLTLSKDASKGFSQGRNQFDEMYIFNYWQYVDMVVWWGGSSGEGVFVCPTGSAIDAAHKNGVKILGNIFFAPSVYGGQAAWVDETLEKDSLGNYIIADKLIEIANYFGFDGWFLNEETKHFSDKDEWEKFCAYYSAKSDLELQMYNATSSFSSSNGWMLRDSNGNVTGTSYFVNYGGTGNVDDHVTYAESIGASKWDLYYGLNQGTSAYSNNAGIQAILGKDNHKASLSPFMERVTWRLNSTQEKTGTGVDHINSYFKVANKYWVGAEEPNPGNDRSAEAWSGMANYIPSRTFIQSKPFVTTFNSGYGIRRNIKGVDQGEAGQQWVHQGMQDILPTWRWWWQDAANKELSCELTLDDAYEGGNSLKVEGNLNANDANEVRLYKTKIAIENGDVFKLVFKNSVAGQSNIQVGLAFAEDNNAFTYLSAGTASGAWDVKEFDLSAYAGKTLSMISLKFESTSAVTDFTSYIGELGVFGADALSCSAVSNIKSEKKLGIETGNIRLTWDAATGDVLHYNIYFEQDGNKKLVGQTPSTAFFVPEIERTKPSETGVKISVVPVAKDFKESTESSLTINWQDIPLPGVKIKANSTFAVTGTEITFTAIASYYPTNYAWTTPQGAELVSAAGNEAVFRFPEEGTYDVSVDVTNLSGTTSYKIEELVTIDNTNKLTNVILKKTVVDHNGHYGSEAPEKLIDGITDQGGSEKWCFGGAKEHYMIVDLGRPYKLFNSKIFDTKLNEDAPNLKNYKILVSDDNTEGSYVELFDEDGNREADTIKIDHFKGVIGQFVKFVPYDKTDEITIRLWELEIYGLAGPDISVETPKDLSLNKSETSTITLKYDLAGETKADNFGIKVLPLSTTDSSLISISNVVVNDTSVSFDITSSEFGDAYYMVKLTNGEWFTSIAGKVVVEYPFWVNLALNRTVNKGDASRYGEEVNTIDLTVDGDTNTYWVTKLGCDLFSLDLERKCDVYRIYAKYTQDSGSYSGRYNKLPNSVVIRYSDDSATWTEVEVELTGNELNVPTNYKEIQYIELKMNISGSIYYHYGLFEVVVTGNETGDTDMDGVTDDKDNCPETPNADQADEDGNGVGDACEPTIEDADKDGIADDKDNCPNIANPDQADADGDGIGDVCEDTDEDGVYDVDDNCPTVANADQADADGDGIGDVCEDTDEDGVYDVDDNCPTVANADQADADGDGIGDVCEDTDEDGVYDVDDNCPTVANADQADADGDGIGDACESTGINVADNDNLKVYPNPFTSKLNIASEFEIEELIIKDIVGKIIEQKTVKGTEATLNLSDVSGGLYYVTIVYSNGDVKVIPAIKN